MLGCWHCSDGGDLVITSCNKREYKVKCRECGSTGPIRSTMGGAAKAWDTRDGLTCGTISHRYDSNSDREIYELSCGHEIGSKAGEVGIRIPERCEVCGAKIIKSK